MIPFCTSGGGSFTNRAQIKKLLPGIAVHKELNKATTEAELKAWLCEKKI